MTDAATHDDTAHDEPTGRIPLSQVEHELSRQMQDNRESDEAPALRARMSNLVVYCDSTALAEKISLEVPGIVAIHPARVLLLVGEPGSGAGEITASVSAWCRLGASKQKICSEQITLRATGHSVDRLSFAVRRLLIGDLPVNFWWAPSVPPTSGGAAMYQVSSTAQQIMYDSIGWPEPARGVVAVSAWLEQMEQRLQHGNWCVASDLNWRRLRDWRRTLSQAIDPASAPGAIESIQEVQVEHGPHAVIQAWEFTSWLVHRLKWRVQAGKIQQGAELDWRLSGPRGDVRLRIVRLEKGSPEIQRVRVTCQIDGRPVVLDISNEDGARLKIFVEGAGGAARTVTLQPQRLADLVGRQLSDRQRDPTFLESMAVAQTLAKSLTG